MDNSENTGKKIRYADIENIEDPGKLFDILVNVMATLRSEDGCMWDREQTHQSIKKNLLEEAYEAVQSIEENNSANLKEEMGDILLQVVFHSRIADESGNFDIAGVLKTIINKLIRRHPHVFGDVPVADSREILSNWEDIKKKERKEKPGGSNSKSVFANIPGILPALHLAYEIQTRAARFDFDWENPDDVVEKIHEEISELNIEYGKFRKEKDSKGVSDEIGDLLFSIVNLCRHLGIDSEQVLKQTCGKFTKRFDYMQEYSENMKIDFKSLSLKEKDKIWELAKKEL
jgi:tetrapyrrole methylase family protein / MazG family protein